jgi:hypothetical protein
MVYIDSAIFIITSTVYRDALFVNTLYENCVQVTNMCNFVFHNSQIRQLTVYRFDLFPNI